MDADTSLALFDIVLIAACCALALALVAQVLRASTALFFFAIRVLFAAAVLALVANSSGAANILWLHAELSAYARRLFDAPSGSVLVRDVARSVVESVRRLVQRGL